MRNQLENSKQYWNEFYKNCNCELLNTPTSFAIFCIEKYLNKKSNIVEIGSGNGRDSIYFAHKKHTVYAIDLSHEAIKLEQKIIPGDIQNNINLINDNFITYNYNQIKKIDVFYSRFTMHTITEKDEDIILQKIYDSLSQEGLCFIEARTINDPMMSKGTKLSQYEIYTDHYRRFIDSNKFLKKCLKLGFSLEYFTEEKNLSIYNNDNPALLRIILKKN